MSVIYIHPSKQGTYFKPETKMGRPYGLIPVGLPAIVNALRQNGIQVRGINHSLEFQFKPDFNLQQWLSSQSDARVVLIDLHWYEHCFGAIDTARLVKKILPSAYTILGGLTASAFAGEILQNFPEVDFIVRGDAEAPLLSLIKLILTSKKIFETSGLHGIPNLTYRISDGVKHNPIGYTASTQDLDQLDFVNLDFLEHAQDYLVHEYIVTDLPKARQAMQTNPFRGRWLTTARGCKYECIYCGGCKSAHKILAGREKLVIRSPEVVVDELDRLQHMGVHQASLSYDIAELGEEWWKSFFSCIRNRKIKIGLYNEFFQMPSVDFVNEFINSSNPEHSCVALSPLSGNEHVRKMNGKHFSNDELFDMLALLSQHHAHLFVYFSLNLPGESPKSILETIDLARDIYHFYPNQFLKIINSLHTIDPLSPMNIYADRFGIQSTLTTFMDYYQYCRETQFQSPGSRTGLKRGFLSKDLKSGDLEKMADAWDRERLGREISWWPIPPSW